MKMIQKLIEAGAKLLRPANITKHRQLDLPFRS